MDSLLQGLWNRRVMEETISIMSCPLQANETYALSFFLEWKFLCPSVCSPLNMVTIAKI